jgi:endonuclease III
VDARLKGVLDVLGDHFEYDDIQTYPRFDHPDPTRRRDYWHVLVQIVISQRTTLEQEVAIAGALFERFPTLGALDAAELNDIEDCLRTAGLYKQKSLAIKKLARTLLEDYGGDLGCLLSRPVEEIRAELLRLPMVGYKTADCMLELGFGVPWLAVDTNVRRVSLRLGLVRAGSSDYEEIREQLQAMIPKNVELVREAHTYLLALGKYVCKARPKCSQCPVVDQCPSADASLVRQEPSSSGGLQAVAVL